MASVGDPGGSIMEEVVVVADVAMAFFVGALVLRQFDSP